MCDILLLDFDPMMNLKVTSILLGVKKEHEPFF